LESSKFLLGVAVAISCPRG